MWVGGCGCGCGCYKVGGFAADRSMHTWLLMWSTRRIWLHGSQQCNFDTGSMDAQGLGCRTLTSWQQARDLRGVDRNPVLVQVQIAGGL